MEGFHRACHKYVFLVAGVRSRMASQYNTYVIGIQPLNSLLHKSTTNIQCEYIHTNLILLVQLWVLMVVILLQICMKNLSFQQTVHRLDQ